MTEPRADSDLPEGSRSKRLSTTSSADEGPTALDPARRDARLLAAWRDGDWEAGLKLMQLYYGYFSSLCRSFGLKTDDDQIDLFHDVVIRLHDVLATLTIERSFAAYLRKVVFTSVRARGVRRQEPIPKDIAKHETSPTDKLEREELLAAILECADSLKDREKTLFHERHFRKRKLVDIAERQSMTLDHLYVLYHRVRKKMMACLIRKGVRL